MSGFTHSIAGGAGNLVIDSFQSPNFQAGIQGWQVTKTGDAEFNSVKVRGSFLGTDFQINDNGAFFYGPPTGSAFTAGAPFASAVTPFTLTPSTANTVVVFAITESVTAWVMSLSSSNVNWSVLVAPQVIGATYQTVFIGEVTSGAAAPVTVAFSSGAPAFRLSGLPLRAVAGFGSVGLETTDTVNATTTLFPPLTPAAAGECYVGYAFNGGTAVPGVTPGYTYYVDPNGNGLAYNTNCGSGVQQPAWSDTDALSGTAVLLTAPQPAALIASVAPAAGVDPFGNHYPQGVAAITNGSFVQMAANASSVGALLFTFAAAVHASVLTQIFGAVTNAGAVNESLALVLASGKESGNDDAALQLFSQPADASAAASAVLEFGGAIGLTVTKQGVTIPAVAAAPPTPASGVTLYYTGGKLTAKGPSGTAVVIATT